MDREGYWISDYTVEVTHNFTPEYIDYIIALCTDYGNTGKEIKINYTEDRLRHNFTSGRFAHGFYVIKCKEKVVLTFGVDEFKGWGVIARLLRHNTKGFLIPVLGGVGLPFLYKHLEGKIKGLCWTHNVGARDVGAILAKRLQKTMPAPIGSVIATAANLNNIKKLDYNIWYRNTIQEAYTFEPIAIPPFDRV